MKVVRIGRVDFACGGDTLIIQREGKEPYTVPLAEVSLFVRYWEEEMKLRARESMSLNIHPSIMGRSDRGINPPELANGGEFAEPYSMRFDPNAPPNWD